MQLRSLAPALLFPVLALSATPVAAQVTSYGSGVNPPGSLALLSGTPQIGGTFVLGVANTAVSDAPVGLALLSLATAPAPGFPAGLLLPGLGMSGPSAPGELLLSALSPDPLITLGPVFWFGGTNAPAAFSLSVPFVPALSGLTFYAQGGLLTPALGYSIGLTNGLAVQLGTLSFPGLVLIPAGTFSMGSNAPSGEPYLGGSSTQPVHEVTISRPFWMGRHEVTQAEYQALMGTNPSSILGSTRPVEGVSWFAAVAYCEALNAQESALGTVPEGYQYRLPTEAEWEYACRAGTTTEFHYGTELLCGQARIGYSNHSNSYCNSGTAPVGSYAPNAWGLYDMHGNVLEWCMDRYAYYTPSAKVDPYVPEDGNGRVMRSGAWFTDSYVCRSAYRNHGYMGADPGIGVGRGVRVVLAPVLAP